MLSLSPHNYPPATQQWQALVASSHPITTYTTNPLRPTQSAITNSQHLVKRDVITAGTKHEIWHRRQQAVTPFIIGLFHISNGLRYAQMCITKVWWAWLTSNSIQKRSVTFKTIQTKWSGAIGDDIVRYDVISDYIIVSSTAAVVSLSCCCDVVTVVIVGGGWRRRRWWGIGWDELCRRRSRQYSLPRWLVSNNITAR